MVVPPTVTAIALSSLLFWTEAFAQAKTYWYCQFTPFGQQNVRYLSDVFGPTENTMSVDGSTQQKILTAFEDFVAGKYSESGGSAGCAYFDSASLAKDDKKQNEDLIAKNGGRSIETGWEYQGPP